MQKKKKSLSLVQKILHETRYDNNDDDAAIDKMG